ncbi:hypothetical protein [Streptomyces sp. NPDC005435]|uniref:hypothetical protein n=1 Tax=Streptomyces sp. NPDC005435 TaxID=3154464 RepID=UPI003451B678
MLPADRIRTLLREHDDPDHLERPENFDLPSARDAFARLVSALEEAFGPSCSNGLGQDTSYYGGIKIPVEATGLGRPLWVQMSNFGAYFVTAGTGAHWGAPDCEGDPPGEFSTWLDQVCTAAGCTFVPVQLLLEPYDGPSELAGFHDAELATALEAFVAAGGDLGIDGDEDEEEELRPDTWHDRYFEYM